MFGYINYLKSLSQYVKMMMNNPFGSDSYIECYIQLKGNEEIIKYMYHNFKNDKNSGIYFTHIYSEDNVDSLLAIKAFSYTGSHDVEKYVKLMGPLKINTEVKVNNGGNLS